jgi:hypothetical protein
MTPTTLQGNLIINGRVTPKELDYPVGSLTNAGLSPSADLETHKMRHQYRGVHADKSGTTTAAFSAVLFHAHGTGELKGFRVGNIAPCIGDSTITVDLKKNGSTVLSSTVVLDNANTARVAEIATVNPSLIAYAANDVFEMVVTVSAGTGTLGTGLFGSATFNELPVT